MPATRDVCQDKNAPITGYSEPSKGNSGRPYLGTTSSPATEKQPSPWRSRLGGSSADAFQTVPLKLTLGARHVCSPGFSRKLRIYHFRLKPGLRTWTVSLDFWE